MLRTSLLQLFNLVSPALPIGAFAYSQGQEYAIDAGWIEKPEQLESWLSNVLTYGVAPWDGALLIRMHRAVINSESNRFQQLNQELLASRETKELWLEDQQVGKALAKLLSDQQIKNADWLHSQHTVASGFAIAGAAFELDIESLLTGYYWSWLENQIAVAGKALPLGQTQAQQLIQQLLGTIDQAVTHTLNISDQDIGNTLPGFAMASALHEHQYSRLFRS